MPRVKNGTMKLVTSLAGILVDQPSCFYPLRNLDCLWLYSLLRSRYWARHATLLPNGEEHCVTIPITAAKESSGFKAS